jgi:AcrR family transcriptional regulator
MKLRERQKVETRRVILEAVAAEVAASGTGFSIQAVADRAGVTHRTVYNYFPTRQALNDAFAEHVEMVLAEQGAVPRPEQDVAIDGWPQLAGEFHTLFNAHAMHLNSYVEMTIASGSSAKVFRDRSRKMEKLLDKELGPFDPGIAKLVTAALRMFISSSGWYLLDKHHGLSPADAGQVSEWAVKTLLDAARKGNVPRRTKKETKDA